MKATSALSLAIAAGCLATPAMASEDRTPEQYHMGTMKSQFQGHIYYNVATGEKIAIAATTGVRPAAAGDEAQLAWVLDNGDPCGVGGTVGILDDPSTSNIDNTWLDWGDIHSDTLVDCFSFSVASLIPDVDTDTDGFGDGVVGFGTIWDVRDVTNGFGDCVTQLPLAGFLFATLPGNLAPPGLVSTYTFIVDLTSSSSSSSNAMFELGDTDSDAQSAFSVNLNSFSDIDADGGHDFGYSQTYIQPGTQDLDGDSVIDGDVANQGLTAINASAPRGVPVDNMDGTWFIDQDQNVNPVTLANGTGSEDVFDLYDAFGTYVGSFAFGDFSCDAGAEVPYTSMDLSLFGPAGHQPFSPPMDCFAELTGDNPPNLNLQDVFAYLALFNANDPAAELTGDDPINLNLQDVFAYLALFNAGCGK